MSSRPREGKRSFETETNKNFIDPVSVSLHPKTTIVKGKISVDEFKSKNKDGLPYDLVFKHGWMPEKSEVF